MEELELLKNEVLRKIGRNVMLFQQMETMLKLILSNASFSGYASEIQKNQEQRATTISKQTMGQLAKQLFENVVVETKETEPEFDESDSEDLQEAWISFRFTTHADADYYKKQKDALTSIVTERNELIHHLLAKWDMRCIVSTKKVNQQLNEQRERILPELEQLKEHIKSLRILAEQFKLVELDFLREILLIEWLIDGAKQKVRPDGWVVLDCVLALIRKNAPDVSEALINIEEYCSHKKMKNFILAAKCFELSEEKTPKGGIRVLYRIKPNLDVGC